MANDKEATFAKKRIDGIDYPFDWVSDSHVCERCGKPIKQRLVVIKKQPPTLCYVHWKELEDARRARKPASDTGGRAVAARRGREALEDVGSIPTRRRGRETAKAV